MGKMYSVTSGLQTVSVAQDLIQIIAGATDNRSVLIHEVRVSQNTDAGDAEAEMLAITLSRFIGAFTEGAAGASVTPVSFDVDDNPAADAACERNNTTQATGGTEQILIVDAFNVQAGWHWLPTPEMRVHVSDTDAFIVKVEAPADALDMVCTVVFEES